MRAGNGFAQVASGNLTRVYPRASGAAMQKLAGRKCHFGGSPCARGNPDPDPQRFYRIGWIPVRAGQPPLPSAQPESARVDPRVRGGVLGFC